MKNEPQGYLGAHWRRLVPRNVEMRMGRARVVRDWDQGVFRGV